MTLDPQRAKSLFLAALEQASDERGAFLDEACAGNPELRRRVDQLLQAHDRPDSLPEAPAVPGPTEDSSPPKGGDAVPGPVAATEVAGTVIGPYQLLEPIGEGGMGTVWMAQQTEPVKRLVALKLIKAGMDSAQVIARFEAERQALALMDHANIAKVLDGGTTSAGRPYFVMDLVKGVPITRYCDEHHLTPRQRLELFLPVCLAVQHAHQKGIIHRDLKPSNVLVALYDGKPVPKVIDFGVAKAAGQSLTDKTLVTGFGNIVGTLEYMSPEQAEVNQLDIDTRSDIYSLGVLLYELLTGSPPFSRLELEKAGMLEMLRVIREQEPSKPSTKLSTAEGLPTLAANRGTEPAKLTKLVRGELDWIVMKALEKDRNRRYETANGFAADVQRYLADEPVQACPPSVGYRLRKFARRNRGLFAAGGMVAAALVFGIVGTTWQAIRATNLSTTATAEAERANRESVRAGLEAERAGALAEKAKTEAAIAKAVNEFLDRDLLAQANPYNEPDREIKLRTLVDRAATKLETRFRDQPLVEAAIRETLGNTYVHMGEAAKAEEHFRRALDLRRQHLGPHDAATLESMTNLAFSFNVQTRYVEAEKLHRETLEIRKKVLGAEHPSTFDNLTGLANSKQGQGQFAEAEKLHRQVYEYRNRNLGPEHPHTLLSKSYVGLAIQKQGRHAEAEPLFRDVLAARKRLFRPEHPEILFSMMFLANTLRAQNHLEEAETLYREVYEVRRRVLGPQHPATLRSLTGLAALQKRQGRHAAVKPVWEEGLRHNREGHAHRDAGRMQEAAREFRQAIVVLEPLAEEFPASRQYRLELGRSYIWLFWAAKDSSEKDDLRQQALRFWEGLAEDFPTNERVWTDLGEAYALNGDFLRALDAQNKAIKLNADFAPAWHRRGYAHAQLGQWKEAVADQTRGIELEPKAVWGRWRRGQAYGALNQWSKALADFEEAIELGEGLSEWRVYLGEVWTCKAGALAQLKLPEKAIAALRRAVANGFQDSSQLQTRKDLAPLRELEEFRKLLTELKAKTK